jgi:uncharacterized protein YciI
MRGNTTMSYFVLLYDVVDGFGQRRLVYREEHLKLVAEAHSRGVLMMAGALGDPPSGGLLVFRGASAEAAEEFARRDPYVLNGLVTNWSVKPWSVVVQP